MKKIDREVLKDAAKRLMFDMEESQYDVLEKEFGTIITQMELIGRSEGLEEYLPMTFPFETGDGFLREDVPTAPLAREDVLRNAKDVIDGQISLPKVVG